MILGGWLTSQQYSKSPWEHVKHRETTSVSQQNDTLIIHAGPHPSLRALPAPLQLDVWIMSLLTTISTQGTNAFWVSLSSESNSPTNRGRSRRRDAVPLRFLLVLASAAARRGGTIERRVALKHPSSG